jgi:DNA-binding CsgD family transcriptional regulator
VAISDLTPPPTDRRSRAESGLRLFERGPLLAEFEAIFSRTLQVPSRCIAVEGSWGSGRTALINAACETARRSECLVLRARGGDVEKQIPFAVLGKFIESAAALAGGSGTASEQANALQRLLGSGDVARHDPADISPLFHSLVIALRELGPVLLAVDDADLADRETLAVLEYVVRRLDDQQIWLLLTARPLHPGIGLRPVDGLLTESETRQFILEPLLEESVRSMLAGFFDEEPDQAFVVACRQATGGSPLFLKTLLPCLARWHVRPTAEMADRVERVPAPKITQLVLSRLAQLPVAASDLLRACAVLGEGAEPTVARLVAKIDALAAERAADAAGHMELLRPSRPYAFSSPLIRWAVYFDIPTARRSQLHARAAQLLAEHGATEAAVAEHLLATQPVGDVEMAQRLQEIGRAALAADDPHLALRCLNRALAESPPASRGGSLYLDLASVELALGRPSALSHFRRAVQMGVTDDSELIQVAVGLLLHVASAPQLRAETARAVQELTNRLAGVDPELSLEFELALAMAMASGQPTDRQQGLERLRTLVAPSVIAGAESALPQMASTFIAIQEAASASPISADQLAEALEAVTDANLFNGSDPLVAEIQTLAYQGLLVCDRFAKADELLLATLKDAHQRGIIPSEQRASVLLATSLLWQGSLTAAEEAYRHGRALGTEHGAELRHRATLGLVDTLLRQGRIDEAEELLDQLQPDGIHSPAFESGVRIERGRLLVARGHLRQGLDQFIGAGSDAVRGGIINAALSSWRADAAMVLSMLGDWADADRLAHEHLSMARQFGATRSIGVGLRAAAAATPDLVERTTLLSEAVGLLEPSPARLEASYALVELGMVLVDRGKKEEARGVLRRGANLASLCGAHQLVESAGVQLRAAGARPRRLGSIGPDSLTPSERRVARLAAAGKTNQGIAADLYVTVKTVEGHLAKTYRKLGVDSRRSLALVLGDDDEDNGDLLDASSL